MLKVDNYYYVAIIIIFYSHSLSGVLEKKKKYTDLCLGPYWMGRRGGKKDIRKTDVKESGESHETQDSSVNIPGIESIITSHWWDSSLHECGRGQGRSRCCWNYFYNVVLEWIHRKLC